jgi:hypothetical protein
MNIPSSTPPAPGYSSSGGGTNQMALVSLIAGGVTWFIGWLGGCAIGFILPGSSLCTGLIGFIATVIGIITGHMGLGQTGPGSPESGSRWMAITGLALNYVSLALLALIMCGALLLFLIFGAAIFSNLDINEIQRLLTETATP